VRGTSNAGGEKKGGDKNDTERAEQFVSMTLFLGFLIYHFVFSLLFDLFRMENIYAPIISLFARAVKKVVRNKM
jgi:hypothetical protein